MQLGMKLQDISHLELDEVTVYNVGGNLVKIPRISPLV